MTDAKTARMNAERFLAKTDWYVISCRELGDSYVFMTNLKNENDIFPGSPKLQVMKHDGTVKYFDQDFGSYEKLDMLIKAKEIKLSDLR